MAHLDFNFEAVPTVIPQIEAGLYEGEIIAPPEVAESGDKLGTQLNVQLRICGGTFDGLVMTDGIPLRHPKYSNSALQGQSKVKRLAIAAGLTVGASGLDTELLAGMKVKFRVTKRKYEKDGVQKEAAQIDDYIIQ